jgi:hypothetical protein
VPYFTQQALDNLTAGLAELPPQLRRLKNGCAGLALTNDRAKEYLQHGLSRRLSTMVQMVQTVFELLPPADEAIPENVTVMAATACIQNFVMNAFGCLENLAWIWVLEKDIRGKGGAELGRYDTEGAWSIPPVDDALHAGRRTDHSLSHADAARLRHGRRLLLDAHRGIRTIASCHTRPEKRVKAVKICVLGSTSPR